MATKKKLLQAAAGTAAAGGAGGLNVEDVFSTYLYEGNGSTQTITNGIDLDGEGGLVWTKSRVTAYSHELIDTERGTKEDLRSHTTDRSVTMSSSAGFSSFNSDGYSIAGEYGTWGSLNVNGEDHVSWTFRKAPKFFDVVTYTGDGVAGRTVSHNLGSVPGCVIVKRTNSSGSDWWVYHRGGTANNYTRLNLTNAETSGTIIFNDTAPTDSVFTVGTSSATNGSGNTYVAYLFAHNDGDGGFGPDGDVDIIKCGSFTDSGSSSTPTDVNLGFEPQWLLVKASSTSSDWYMIDVMREMSVNDGRHLRPNLSNAETNFSVGYFKPTPTGFQFRGDFFGSGQTAIYIAIRRGPMAVPESATDVFDIDTRTGSLPSYVSTFPVDMALRKLQSISGSWTIGSRLTGNKQLVTSSTNSEGTDTDWAWDYMEGYGDDPNVAYALYSWMWKRAPSYFDVVAYTGTGGASQSISHNLGVTPEMIWVKDRGNASNWSIYHSATGISEVLNFASNAAGTGSQYWGTNSHTSSDFKVGSDSDTGGSGKNYIAYLFASLDGVSKVGSYAGNGSSQNIDCGFSSGARFVLIKSIQSGSWYVFDTERGIVAGNDSHLKLNTDDAEAYADSIDPYSSGFTVVQNATTDLNKGPNDETYIFYAIA